MSDGADSLVLLEIALEEFGRRLRLVGPGDWRRATPCTEWDVRALVNHVVGANVRYQLLLDGASTEQVEATRSVDHLGDDAVAAFVASAERMIACFHKGGVLERVTHHVTGDRTGHELVAMRILDAAVHAWDLARAIGADETLPDDVVAFLLAYSAELDLGPQQHAFATTDAVLRNASLQDQLLHKLGRNPNTKEIR
ncbi:TIGR03086 family metal-binding protein [Kribbella monticola]|uniref:TIGR03086 family metal-binding protein n=1 Tax=Kribbella monticola TaxID=2185285 RepID=UPI000DD4E149|nr:TIGR03086 family metal-binding protein [Kribbella monticola]